MIVNCCYRLKDSITYVAMIYIALFYYSLTAPTEPNNLQLTQLGQTFITVSWNSPFFPRGPITYYIVSAVISTAQYCDILTCIVTAV